MSISRRNLKLLTSKAKTEIGEAGDKIPKSIEQLKVLISESRVINLHPRAYDETIYLPCIRAAKYDIQRAAKLYLNFCKMRQKCIPGLREISIPSLQELAFSSKVVSVLAQRDRFGRQVILIRLSEWDTKMQDINAIFAALFLLLDESLLSVDTQFNGFVIIGDTKGFGVSHAKMVRLSHCEAFFKTVQNSYPARFKEIHILNNHYLINILLTASKPFIKEKMRNRLICHGSDLDSFLNSVDPNILPECVGGTLSDDEYDDKDLVTRLMQKDEYYKDFLKYGLPEL